MLARSATDARSIGMSLTSPTVSAHLPRAGKCPAAAAIHPQRYCCRGVDGEAIVSYTEKNVAHGGTPAAVPIHRRRQVRGKAAITLLSNADSHPLPHLNGPAPAASEKVTPSRSAPDACVVIGEVVSGFQLVSTFWIAARINDHAAPAIRTSPRPKHSPNQQHRAARQIQRCPLFKSTSADGRPAPAR